MKCSSVVLQDQLDQSRPDVQQGQGVCIGPGHLGVCHQACGHAASVEGLTGPHQVPTRTHAKSTLQKTFNPISVRAFFFLLLICSPSKMVYGVKISFIQKYLKSEKKKHGICGGLSTSDQRANRTYPSLLLRVKIFKLQDPSSYCCTDSLSLIVCVYFMELFQQQ